MTSLEKKDNKTPGTPKSATWYTVGVNDGKCPESANPGQNTSFTNIGPTISGFAFVKNKLARFKLKSDKNTSPKNRSNFPFI